MAVFWDREKAMEEGTLNGNKFIFKNLEWVGIGHKYVKQGVEDIDVCFNSVLQKSLPYFKIKIFKKKTQESTRGQQK